MRSDHSVAALMRVRVSLVFLSTAVPNGTVFEFSEFGKLRTHDLKGDALHALRGTEGMLLAGAAFNAVSPVRNSPSRSPKEASSSATPSA